LVSDKLYFVLGRDSGYSYFSGTIGFVKVNIGSGSFRPTNDFSNEKDGRKGEGCIYVEISSVRLLSRSRFTEIES